MSSSSKPDGKSGTSKICLICNKNVPDTTLVTLNPDLYKLLSEIVEKPLEQKNAHSNYICAVCHHSCSLYNRLKQNMEKTKTELTAKFKSTVLTHGISFDTYPKKLQTTTSPPSLNKRVVLPASKLQPLPADYVLNVASLPSSVSSSQLSLPKIVNSTAAPTINLKVTVGSAVLTHSIKTTTPTSTSTTKTSGNISKLIKRKTSNEIINFDVNMLPKDFLANAVMTKTDNQTELKIEIQENELNNEEHPMEIDEDCTVVRLTSDENDQLNTEEEVEDKDLSEKPQYFDVSLLPLSEGSTNDTILGKLQILNQDGENEETETIVMSGENGEILRIMSGQKLVYENGELTLADDDNSNQDDDNQQQDSNDESQIELQVSGDEETAKAIIAAAQEQGGAFIKVESGEMYRVQSVHSKLSSSVEDTSIQMVVQEGDLFKCLLCENIEKDPTTGQKPSFEGDSEQIMVHLRRGHDARVYICKICKKVMRKRNEHIVHMAEHSASKDNDSSDKSKLHECKLCNKKYNSRTLLQEHMNVHNGKRPYTCSVCEKTFASKYTWQGHMKTHCDRPRPFKCLKCPKSFFSQQNLNQHEKTHLGIKDFVCNKCGKAFGTQHNLEVHGVVHSGKKPYICGVCGKAFARRAEVKDHMRIHTGERPFACEWCGARFSQRSNLHSHRRATHQHDKRHHCQHCPKQFKRRRLLEYHIKASHTGERPLQCAVCHATFVYPEHYKKHLRIHSGEKPYFCEVCGKSFNSRDNRNTHRFVHSDKKPYECLVCGAGYMRKQLLYAHMNTSGHLAESIVVNQPRMQGKAANQPSNTGESEKLDTILECATELHIVSSPSPGPSPGPAAPAAPAAPAPGPSDVTRSKMVVTDRTHRYILQDDKGTINLVQDTDDPTLLTFIPSVEAVAPLQEQMQMVTSDESGAIRLVQFHVNANPATWIVKPA